MACRQGRQIEHEKGSKSLREGKMSMLASNKITGSSSSILGKKLSARKNAEKRGD